MRGRTPGIVGYGNIDTQLSNVAEAIGLPVILYDTADRLAHGNAHPVWSLHELLQQADIVSLHVDGRPGNAGLFGAEQFTVMKQGAAFINASRGMVVDDHALREHILSRHLSGAAIDVFPSEPKAQGDSFESPLRGLENVILTPTSADRPSRRRRRSAPSSPVSSAPSSTRGPPHCRSTLPRLSPLPLRVRHHSHRPGAESHHVGVAL